MEDKIDAALTCDKGCGHTVDYETCYAHQVQKVKNLLLEATLNDYLDQCFPSSDHNDIRAGDYTGGGFISDNIILDRIAELQSQLGVSK